MAERSGPPQKSQTPEPGFQAAQKLVQVASMLFRATDRPPAALLTDDEGNFGRA